MDRVPESDLAYLQHLQHEALGRAKQLKCQYKGSGNTPPQISKDQYESERTKLSKEFIGAIIPRLEKGNSFLNPGAPFARSSATLAHGLTQRCAQHGGWR